MPQSISFITPTIIDEVAITTLGINAKDTENNNNPIGF